MTSSNEKPLKTNNMTSFDNEMLPWKSGGQLLRKLNNILKSSNINFYIYGKTYNEKLFMWNLYKKLIAIILWLLKIRRHIPINSGILCMHTDKRGQTMKNDNDMTKFKKHNIVWSVHKRYSICSIHIYQIYMNIWNIYMKFWDGRNSLQ